MYNSMATSLRAFPTCKSVNFHVRPVASSNSVDLSVEEQSPVFTCSERQGVWFLCHTRSISGWVHGKEVVPVSFPSVFIVNDELPPDAQIRLRAK